MSKKLIFLLFVGFISVKTYSQSLEIFVDYKRFFTPEKQAVFEVYLQVNASSVMLKSEDKGMYRSNVEVTEIIHMGDSIVNFRKKSVVSPLMTDSTIADFLDQERFILNPGDYELEIIATDLNLQEAKFISTRVPFTIDNSGNSVGFSDIQQIERYSKAEKITPLTKSGYDLVPYVSRYFTSDIKKIAFYAEMYNSLSLGTDEKFILNQFITDQNGVVQDGYFKFSKQSASTVVPVLGVFDISKLKTGHYFLVLEARDKNNDVLCLRKFEFFRTNPVNYYSSEDLLKMDIRATFVDKITNEDTLKEYIACLRPIATPSEMLVIDTIILSNGNLLNKQKYFYSFWLGRDQKTPEYAWLKYKAAVDDVNRMFATPIKKGYMSDRGIIFLKYGAPDDVMDRPNEPSSYPYQIWHYHKLGQFNNKRFIFYMPDLVTNEYITLHSDVIGEVKNYRWEQILNSRNSPNIDIDNGSGGNKNHWGGNGTEFFKNPR